MALILKRVTNPYECVRCDITRKIISYGEEYYYDTEDGAIIDFNYFHDMKWAQKKEEGMQEFERYMGLLDYRQYMIQRQRDYLRKTMLDRHQLSEDVDSWNASIYGFSKNGDEINKDHKGSGDNK